MSDLQPDWSLPRLRLRRTIAVTLAALGWAVLAGWFVACLVIWKVEQAAPAPPPGVDDFRGFWLFVFIFFSWWVLPLSALLAIGASWWALATHSELKTVQGIQDVLDGKRAFRPPANKRPVPPSS